MRIISSLFLVLFCAISSFAQNPATISGLVLVDGNKPIAGVNITLSTSSGEVFTSSKAKIISVNSDSNGRFIFENLVYGKYILFAGLEDGRICKKLLTISKNKIVSVKVYDGVILPSKIIKYSPNQEFIVDLELGIEHEMTTSIKETVKISANLSQPIDEVSKTINIISGQEMRERADFSLVESLRTIPGFRVQQLGGFGRTATIKTRGLRNQDTAILIDGIRFRDASAITGDASAFLSDFTLTSISRLEVLRGSGSSLYGTNAIGGVIDFQTPKPQRGLHGQFSSAFGGYGLQRYRGNISDGTDNGKFGYNLGISRTLYTKGIDGDDDAHNTNFQSRIEYQPFENTNISARFFVSDAYVKLNSNPDTIGTLPSSNTTIIDAVPLSISELNRYTSGTFTSALNRGSSNLIPDTNDPDNFQKSNFFNGQLVLTQVISQNLFFQGSYQGLKTNRRNENGTRGVGFQSNSLSFFDGQIHTANGKFNWTPNRTNNISFGYEYEYEKFGNDGVSPTATANFFVRAKQTSNTVYAQDLLSFFNNKLQLAGGFRAQFFSLKNPEFSKTNAPYNNLNLENPPNAYTFDGSASYFFEKSGTKLRAHVGNGYRVPSLYERFGTFYSSFSQSFTALGDPNLKPERTVAYDGGIEQNLFGNKAKLSATYFYTKLNDIIGYVNSATNIGTTARPSGGYFNTKGGISRGAEFSGEFKASRSTDIFTSYTFTNSDQRIPQVAGSRIIQTLGIPDHQFTLVATQRFQRFWVNFDFLATSNYLAPIFSNTTFGSYIYRFKGNRKGDLTAGYTIPFNNDKLNLRIFGTIENVFGYDYLENGFRTFDRTGRAGFAFSF